jgi:hypothetical protein
MSAIGDIVGAIEGRLAALGFAPTDEVFSFDAIPSSIIHKSFRLETRMLQNDYHLGDVGNPIEAIDIYVVYRTLRNPRTAWKLALSDREVIEKDLINAVSICGLSCDPLLHMNGEATAQAYKDDFLISRLVFTVNYLQDLA